MDAYSREFRRDVLRACDAGGGTLPVALKFGVSESWVRRIKQQRCETGRVAPATTRRRIPRWHVIHADIRRIVEARPDRTLRKLKAELESELGEITLYRALRRMKLTFTKSPDCSRT